MPARSRSQLTAKEEILAGLRTHAKPKITRFKGLGEMPPETLAKTILDVRHRTLLRVVIDSTLEADKTFVELLGKDASSRYKFIIDHAVQAEAEDLDVWGCPGNPPGLLRAHEDVDLSWRGRNPRQLIHAPVPVLGELTTLPPNKYKRE